MNKNLIFPVLTALLTFATFASAAPTKVGITNGDDTGATYSTLYTEANWQQIMLPMSQFGDVMPSNLTLSTAGLPDGVSVTLVGAETQDGFLMLNVDVERSDTSVLVNGVADLSLHSGDTVVATFQLPVLGLATEAN
jgi:hypothetical protein